MEEYLNDSISLIHITLFPNTGLKEEKIGFLMDQCQIQIHTIIKSFRSRLAACGLFDLAWVKTGDPDDWKGIKLSNQKYKKNFIIVKYLEAVKPKIAHV